MTDALRVAAPPAKPLLVFDGDCDFCRRWIQRWSLETGPAVEYLPFQDARIQQQFPELPRQRCEQAVQLIETDGSVYSAADAVFRSLAHSPRRRWPLWVYRRWPGAAALSEWAYRGVASHRTLFSWLTRLFWGRHLAPPSYSLTGACFLRWMGLIYLIAFVSLWTQVIGLVGRNGILPAQQRMDAVREHFDRQQAGLERYASQPTFCWFSTSDRFLHSLCGTGTVLALLVLIGVAPAPCLFLLWAIYLSLATVCDVFLGYQWDILLLETGFLALWLAPGRWWLGIGRAAKPSPTALWLLRWLLFRLMFQSGVVKLASGDATWRNLTAMEYHYETQPLPTALGWFAHQLPDWLQRITVAGMFGIELAAPLLIFLPRRLRLWAFWLFVALQVGIAMTGNYCFFNLLALGLCLLLLDDAALKTLVPLAHRFRLFPVGRRAQNPGNDAPHHESFMEQEAPGQGRFGGMEILRRGVLGLVAATVLLITAGHLFGMLNVPIPWPKAVAALYQAAQPFRTVNSYGLFAVMTTSRPEIILEGSQDRQTWLPYEFRYKPGDLQRAPRFVAPHQPRLDWQMWFAALGNYQGNPWFLSFCVKLLQGSPEVLALVGRNPFPERPPRYLRAVVYEYHFTDWQTRRDTGAWWRRERKGLYCPELSLRQER